MVVDVSAVLPCARRSNKAVHLTTVPAHFSARLLRSSLCCQKRAVVGDLWRWPRVEHCAKSAGNRVCPEASLRHKNSVAAGRAHAARKAAQSEKARIVILRSAIEDLTRDAIFTNNQE